MKHILLLLIALTFSLYAKAQKSDSTKIKDTDTTVYTSAEHMPEFPGGIEEFYRYLAHSIRCPASSRINHVQGRVIVRMIIEKDGSLSHIQVLRSVSPDLDKEAIRVIKGCPKWIPATQAGKIARTIYAIPISFKSP